MLAELLALFMSQTCVAEIDFQDTPRECVCMWAINDRTAHRVGRTWKEHTMRYNTYWRSAYAQARKPWILELNAEGGKPQNWPKRLHWPARREMFLRYVQAARRYLKGFRPGWTCGRARHYGSLADGAPCAKALEVYVDIKFEQMYWQTFPCRDNVR